jgi:hypothetical protein
MMFCFNDKLYNALLYWPCARSGVVRIQNPYSIFNRRTKSEKMFSCINYWKGKDGWQFPFKRRLIITFFYVPTVSRSLASICNVEGDSIAPSPPGTKCQIYTTSRPVPRRASRKKAHGERIIGVIRTAPRSIA